MISAAFGTLETSFLRIVSHPLVSITITKLVNGYAKNPRIRNVYCRIFGHHGKDADNIIYINWLNMVRAGLCGLEFYTPETGTWRQVIY